MKNLIQLDKAYLYISCLIYCSRSLLSISSCIFLFSIFVFHLSCCHCFLNCLVFNKCLYPNILELFFFFFLKYSVTNWSYLATAVPITSTCYGYVSWFLDCLIILHHKVLMVSFQYVNINL